MGPLGHHKKRNPIPQFLLLDHQPLLKGATARDKLKKHGQSLSHLLSRRAPSYSLETALTAVS
jgi:hypothetical protein